MITIVSGLPRSGTSLMMQILNAGGMEVLTDNLRKADENNLKGYYEYEKVKSLMKDNSWLKEADGKALKIIAQLLQFLPDNFEYKIIFMERNIEEVINSQNKMIDELGGKKTTVGSNVLKKTFLSQTEKIKKSLIKKSNYKIAFANYNVLIENGLDEIERLNNELDLGINVENSVSQIDKSLYRSK